MYSTRVFVLLALLIKFVHSFSWDIVVGRTRQLEFYYNERLTLTEEIPSANVIHSITYDPVHNRVLIVDYQNLNMSIFSFDISTKKIQLLFSRDSNESYNARVVYDPATQLLFWKKNRSIHFFSYESDKVGEEHLLVTLDHICLDIAVDSCGAYIYWITHYEIERARLDGSEREVIIDSKVDDRRSLAIDQQTQKIYWTEKISENSIISIESANFNGKNRTTLYSVRNDIYATSLAVSKDLIYWQQFTEMGIWQLPKNLSQNATRILSNYISSCVYCRHVAAYYTIKEQIQGIKSCEAIQYLIPRNSKPESTVSICKNYCFQGDCSVSPEGQPICSCKIGYSGERCQVDMCHKHCLNGGVCSLNEEDEPACQCTADYDGERCEVTACKDNCVSTEEGTKFRCDAGNSGESEVNACHQYCLNSGVCSLEKSEPVCQCPADYEGERCDVPAFLIKCFLYAYKNIKMRIIHYKMLIENEESQAISLRNCSVVIDGQYYLHNMYEESGIPFVFGCETNKYAEYLKRQFIMYKRANVKCYILFKGGDMDMEKKIKKFRQEFFDFDTNCVFVPPVFIKDATVEVINAMGIDYAFCVTDTKDECVALALKLECPIISFDIEYCFRRAPYIPSPTMNFDDRTKSIQCRQYKLRNFLQKNSMTEEKTAIFAALTDTTVFPIDFFDSLLETWGVFRFPQYRKLKSLIIWLSINSEEEARDGISKKLTNDEDRSKFWFNYYKILTNMRNGEPGHVTEYLLGSNIPIMKQDPKWFEKGVICKHIPPVYINLYKWKVIDGSWVIDEKSQDSLFLSIDIIKYAYNLLTNYKGGKFKVYQDDNKYIEMLTDDPNVCRPVYDCKESVFENGWDQVKQLKLFEHFLTENCINTEALAKLQPDCVVLFTALVYFARKKQLEGEDVTKEVYAVVLSYVLLSLLYNTETCSKIKPVSAKYFQYDEEEAKRIFDGEISKKLLELQFCIQHMNYLNTLCGSPYESIQYRKMYNGTLIYKMLREIRKRDVDDFVKELFQMTPSVITLVKDLFQVYQEL